jgi:glutathione S-transferase
MSNPTLTVHHLQRGQSERILWLLEELSIPYSLEIHKRDPLLSPPSLKAIHPLGSAPVIIDGDLILSESMAIATYILTKHAPSTNTLTIPSEDPTYPTYLYWLYYVLCTLQPAGSTVMLAYFDPNIPDDAPGRSFPRQRFQRNLELVEKRLGESQFLAGDSFTLVDVMAVWCFTTPRVFLPWSLEPYPNILAYVGRMTSRPAYERAMDKGDHGLPVLNGPEPGEKKAVF